MTDPTPMGLARVEGGRYALCIDALWSTGAGERLFDDVGEPTPFLDEHRKFVEQIESEAERTRLVGRRLVELERLRAMRFDATLPDGEKISVDGFLALDEDKLGALPDATVLDLHRSGVLALLHANQTSLGLMRPLVERRLARRAVAQSTAVPCRATTGSVAGLNLICISTPGRAGLTLHPPIDHPDCDVHPCE